MLLQIVHGKKLFTAHSPEQEEILMILLNKQRPIANMQKKIFLSFGHLFNLRLTKIACKSQKNLLRMPTFKKVPVFSGKLDSCWKGDFLKESSILIK